MAKKVQSYVYGVTPDPRNWHEAADAIKSSATKSKRKKSSGLLDKLSSIEKLLKERK